MDKTGFIEIRISGSKGNIELSPDNYDIREIISLLENVEDLLFPVDKKDRPTISYKIEEGSVKHLLKTSLQYILGFNAIIGQINDSGNIDFLEHKTARAFENIQETAKKREYVFNIQTSLEKSNEIIVDCNTNYYRSESIWVDAEFYFYGKLTNAGGKDKANIHIVTDELGTVRIHTPITFLEKYENNLLYKSLGIRAKGKQNIETGEIDTSTLHFIELTEYKLKYDEFYLNHLIDKGTKTWGGIKNKEQWLREIRGSYET